MYSAVVASSSQFRSALGRGDGQNIEVHQSNDTPMSVEGSKTLTATVVGFSGATSQTRIGFPINAVIIQLPDMTRLSVNNSLLLRTA